MKTIQQDLDALRRQAHDLTHNLDLLLLRMDSAGDLPDTILHLEKVREYCGCIKHNLRTVPHFK